MRCYTCSDARWTVLHPVLMALYFQLMNFPLLFCPWAKIPRHVGYLCNFPIKPEVAWPAIFSSLFCRHLLLSPKKVIHPPTTSIIFLLSKSLHEFWLEFSFQNWSNLTLVGRAFFTQKPSCRRPIMCNFCGNPASKLAPLLLILASKLALTKLLVAFCPIESVNKVS